MTQTGPLPGPLPKGEGEKTNEVSRPWTCDDKDQRRTKRKSKAVSRYACRRTLAVRVHEDRVDTKLLRQLKRGFAA